MKRLNLLIIGLLFFIMLLSNCTIVFDRWAIDWDDDDSVNNSSITIDNVTGETIDTIKFFVDDFPPSNWDNVSPENETIDGNSSKTFTIGPSGKDIDADDGDTIWMRVSADEWYASKLFATDGFTFGTAENDTWNATIYKEK